MTANPDMPGQETAFTDEGLSVQQTGIQGSSIGTAAASMGRLKPSPTNRADELILAPPVHHELPSAAEPATPTDKLSRLRGWLEGPVIAVPSPIEAPEIVKGLFRDILGPTFLSDALVTQGPLAGQSIGRIGLVRSSGVMLQLAGACTCDWKVYQPRWARVDGTNDSEKEIEPAVEPTKPSDTEKQTKRMDPPRYSVAVGEYLVVEFILKNGPAPKGEYVVNATLADKGEPHILFWLVDGDEPKKPADEKSGKKSDSGQLACAGKVRYLIKGVKVGKITVRGTWGKLICDIAVNVFDPNMQHGLALPGKEGSNEYDDATKSNDAYDDEVKKKGEPPKDKVCKLTSKVEKAYWDNHPTRGRGDKNEPGELDNAYNHDKDANRKSWHASWPGFPEWHVILVITAKLPPWGWINWKCEVDVSGDKLDKEGKIAGAAVPWINARDNAAVRKAWESWFAVLLGKDPQSPEVQARVEQITADKEGKRKKAAEPNDSAFKVSGIKVLLGSGLLPCKSGVHHFVFPVRPMPVSIKADGTPTIHSTYYQCHLFINETEVIDSGPKMRVVEYDDTPR